MGLTFQRNSALNDKYEIRSETDHVIDSPDGYKGPLSKIPTQVILDGMIKRGSTLVAEKAVPAKPPTK